MQNMIERPLREGIYRGWRNLVERSSRYEMAMMKDFFPTGLDLSQRAFEHLDMIKFDLKTCQESIFEGNMLVIT